MIYLQIVVTVILLTQLVRVIQNGISLFRQNKVFKESCEQLGDVTKEDIEIQRKAYRLMVEHYEQTFCPECHMPMGSDEKKCSECDVSWALEGEGK